MPLIKRWNFCTYTLSVFSIIVRILSLAERLCSAARRETKLRLSQFRNRISNTTLAFYRRTNLSIGTANMGRNSVAMSSVSHNRSMLTKKANVKFFPVTKDEYSHKKNHAIFIVRHAIF